MADITTTIAGQPVTLIDNLDGTYRIDLSTADARRFIRDGELAQLREERDLKVALRDRANERIVAMNDERVKEIVQRDALNADITALNANITELADWLQSQGD